MLKVNRGKLDELIIANKEKEKRAHELVFANEEKAKRVAELVIANEEKAKQITRILIADEEKAKRVAELVIANEEKQKRADELVIAEEEKAKRVAELVIANEEKQKRVAELVLTNNELHQLLQLNADKDLFISILAHDLRSPFNVLLGLSELLIENIHEYSTDEINNYLKLIKNSAQDTFALLEDLLKWIRAQSGKIPFNPQNLRFMDIWDNILVTLNSNALTKNITLKSFAADNLNVYADNDMLKTVLRNLISNAIKFTNNFGVIKINAKETSENVTILVSDTGVGIIPDKLTKLFDNSQRQSTMGTAEETGSGLGLIICKEFVARHGGKIWAESEYGRGSVFNFTIPKIIKQPVLEI
jgi:signal transduction histidine kinase